MKKTQLESYAAPKCSILDEFPTSGVLCISGGSTNESFEEDDFEM